jgi:hypothetical protein
MHKEDLKTIKALFCDHPNEIMQFVLGKLPEPNFQIDTKGNLVIPPGRGMTIEKGQLQKMFAPGQT